MVCGVGEEGGEECVQDESDHFPTFMRFGIARSSLLMWNRIGSSSIR